MVVVFLMQFCTPYFSSTFSLHLSSHLLYSKLVIPCQECIHPLATQPHVEFFFSSFFLRNLQQLNFFLLHIYSHFIKFIIPTHFWQFYAPNFAFHFQNSHQKAVAFDNIKMRNNENWLNVYSFLNTLSVILEWQTEHSCFPPVTWMFTCLRKDTQMIFIYWFIFLWLETQVTALVLANSNFVL